MLSIQLARLTNITNVHSFMGLSSYYYWLIKKFNFISLHITCLTQKEVPFVLNDECGGNFQELNTFLTSASILTFLIEGKDLLSIVILHNLV